MLVRGLSVVISAQVLLNWIMDFMSLHCETDKAELSKESELSPLEFKLCGWPCLKNGLIFDSSGKLTMGTFIKHCVIRKLSENHALLDRVAFLSVCKSVICFKVTELCFVGSAGGTLLEVKVSMWIITQTLVTGKQLLIVNFSLCVLCLDGWYNCIRKYLILQTNRKVKGDKLFF